MMQDKEMKNIAAPPQEIPISISPVSLFFLEQLFPLKPRFVNSLMNKNELHKADKKKQMIKKN